jgi:metal-dependent amidase/aminoacylase/carboxypeptidase family protein
MTPKDFEWQARIASATFTVQGMLAENVRRFQQGHSDAYGEEYFFAQAKLMDEVAQEAKEADEARKRLEQECTSTAPSSSA